MLKNLLFTVLLLCASNVVFSQSSEPKHSKDSINRTQPSEGAAASKTNKQVFRKNEFPSELKVSPEIIYIINDQPVSREEYLEQNKKKQ